MNHRWVTRFASIMLSAAVLAAATSCSKDEPIPESHAEPPDQALIANIQASCDEVLGTETNAVAAIDHDNTGYCLGPVALTGDGIDSATAENNEFIGWHVAPVFSDDGIVALNAVVAACFASTDACPTTQLAIVVDGFVESAPSIQAASFEADQIIISGGPALTETKSKWMAAQMDRRQPAAGESHPVEIRPVLLVTI